MCLQTDGRRCLQVFVHRGPWRHALTVDQHRVELSFVESRELSRPAKQTIRSAECSSSEFRIIQNRWVHREQFFSERNEQFSWLQMQPCYFFWINSGGSSTKRASAGHCSGESFSNVGSVHHLFVVKKSGGSNSREMSSAGFPASATWSYLSIGVVHPQLIRFHANFSWSPRDDQGCWIMVAKFD